MQTYELRAAFAQRLSQLYGREVPAYTTLVDVTHEVNRDVLAAQGKAAERLGSIDRVTAERHGAIRVGTPQELADAGRIFAAMGMHPTGYYDLRDASPVGIPVVSTAFRPVGCAELARNPFRVFTSLLAVADRRFFSPDLARRLSTFLDARRLFPPRLLELATRAEAEHELSPADSEEFLTLATSAFRLSAEPIDRAWYEELATVSPVAADIGGVRTTHINHLTPRVLDIDDLYEHMQRRGIEMIDEIQGPPTWNGPDVLLRQTSFRALAEERQFREADGSVSTAQLRVRFGEVEARGIALSSTGRERYDAALVEVDTRLLDNSSAARSEVMRRVWADTFPSTEQELLAHGLAHFTFAPVLARTRDGRAPTADAVQLVTDGFAVAEPIVYEDFLPRSAAGIFRSNLDSDGANDAAGEHSHLDAEWLESALERPLHDPASLYEEQQGRSLATVLSLLDATPGAPAELRSG